MNRIELMEFADHANRTAGFVSIPEATRKGRMKWLWQYQAQGGKCYLCGQWFPPAEMTRDHVTARSRGGSTDWENIRLACAECNQKKGSDSA